MFGFQIEEMKSTNTTWSNKRLRYVMSDQHEIAAGHSPISRIAQSFSDGPVLKRN